MTYWIATTIGAVIPAYLLLRMAMWPASWLPIGETQRVVAALWLSIPVHATIAAWGGADGGPLAWGESVPVAMMAGVIAGTLEALRRHHRRRRALTPPDNPASRV